VSELDLASTNHIQFNKGLNESIKGLELHENGLRCLYPNCGFCCQAEASMTKHCRGNHDWVLSEGIQWEECCIQTLFSGPNKRYI
jgi:hypothetical protein